MASSSQPEKAVRAVGREVELANSLTTTRRKRNTQ
jgi:hypothetical protein